MFVGSHIIYKQRQNASHFDAAHVDHRGAKHHHQKGIVLEAPSENGKQVGTGKFPCQSVSGLKVQCNGEVTGVESIGT